MPTRLLPAWLSWSQVGCLHLPGTPACIRKAWRARWLSASDSCSEVWFAAALLPASWTSLADAVVQLLAMQSSVTQAELASFWLLQLLCCLLCAHVLTDMMPDTMMQLAITAAAGLTLLG